MRTIYFYLKYAGILICLAIFVLLSPAKGNSASKLIAPPGISEFQAGTDRDINTGVLLAIANLGDSSPDFKKTNATITANIIASINNTLDGIEIDSFLELYERFLDGFRPELSESEILSAVFDFSKKIDSILVAKGFLLRSTNNMHDNRYILLYRIESTVEVPSQFGDIKAYFVRQVTANNDAKEQEDYGWSSLINDYVVINKDAALVKYTHIIKPAIEGLSPGDDIADLAGDESQQFETLIKVHNDLNKKGFASMTKEKILELCENATLIHEIEHEIRRRMLIYWNKIDMAYIEHGEVLAQLKAIMEADEPWHRVATILRNAFGNNPFMSDLLKKLSGKGNGDEVLEWLQERIEDDNDKYLRKRAAEAYEYYDDLWRGKYGHTTQMVQTLSANPLVALDSSN